MPNVTVSDIITLVKSWVRNQNLSDTRGLQAVNQATDLIKTQMGLPGDIKTSNFDFIETQAAYSTPSDFLEPIGLRYYDNVANRGMPFYFTTPKEIYPRIEQKTSDTRLWSVDYETGSPRLIILSSNTMSALQLDNFDQSASLWTASEDAGDLANDTVTYKEGAGSLKFDIIVGQSAYNQAILSRTISTQDLWQYLNVGHFQFYFQNSNITNFTSVTFKWGTNASNYYTQTVTTQSDGSAFVQDWNLLDFKWATATEVGTPDPHNINFYEIDFNYSAAYTGGTNYRLDDLELITPDTMVLTYYSKYKGTDTSGTTNLEQFTATTDILNIGSWDTGLKNLVAIYAAVILNPQLLNENNEAKEQYKYWTNFYQRRFPRRRLNNLQVNPSISKTD
jgi:hypothetical protein